MRSFKIMLTAALVLGMSAGAFADLQSVTTDGSLRIRGNMFEMDGLGETSFVEQRTRLGVNADFTDGVSAYIELDSYDNWGEDNRSNPWTGADGRAASVNDVEIYQAYVQASEMWGTPLQLRIGRQELSFGSEWLIGVQDTGSIFTGLSFDGVRATYGVDTFSLDFLWMKVSEQFGDFGDDDDDLYGLYFSYLGLDDHVIDAYWLYVREDNDSFGRPGGSPGALATGTFPMARDFTLFGRGGSNEANLHTIGLRGAGTFGAFDYEAEVAFQFGEVELTGGLFSDPELDYDEFGVNLEVGYTFDMNWTPRIFLGAAYLGGGDSGGNADGLFGRGGIFGAPANDLAFNRLFSNWEYSEFLENTALSNVIVYRGGISAAPTESFELALLVSYFQAEDEVETNNIFAELFGSDNVDDDIGFEVGLYADYAYSSDLTFRAGYAHFFTDNGVGSSGNFLGIGDHPGNPITFNGTGVFAGDDDDDWDYLFIETQLSF